MTVSHRRTILYTTITLIFISGIIAATFYDLPISCALTHLSEAENGIMISVPWIASFLEILGEWPAVLLASFSLFVLTSVIAERNPAKGRWISVFSVLCSACLMAYGCFKTADYLTDSLSGLLDILLAAAALGLAIAAKLIIQKIPSRTRQHMAGAAAYTLAAALMVLLLVSSLKVVWGRIRLRELAALGTLDGFTPWYLPNFFSGSHSFPSGHMAHNTILLMLPSFFHGKGERARPFLYLLIFVFLAMMAWSRIAAGAHFLSDVLFGFFISFAVTEWAKANIARRKGSIQSEKH